MHNQEPKVNRKDRREAIRQIKLKEKRVLKVVKNKFKHLAEEINRADQEMTDELIAGYMENKYTQEFPEIQRYFNEFSEARRALTFLSVQKKAVKDWKKTQENGNDLPGEVASVQEVPVVETESDDTSGGHQDTI
jgi:hypothetical protein